MPILQILGAVLVIILIATVVLYNKLIRFKNMVSEGWSGIDVQLKKRYDLIPNLVQTVQSYASHEKALFEEVTQMRSEAINATTVEDQGSAENAISHALGKILVVAENYPDLKANTNFLDLQQQLNQIETDISLARRYYNGTVRNNNIAVESFPNNLVAGWFGFKKAPYFEITEVERQSPGV